MTAVKPDMVFLFTYATSMLTTKGYQEATLSASNYGLLPAFVDGMLEGADPQATLCDGLEPAYIFKEQSQFDNLKRIVREARKFSQAKSKYDSRLTVGFGLWLDSGGTEYGWDPNKPNKNFFSPEEFQKSLERALKTTDKYVWIYSQKINWWTGAGMSPLYLDAIKEARRKAGLP
jgi:hypothetical protein